MNGYLSKFNCFILLIICFITSNSFSQIKIKLEKKNEVYHIPCKVNDIPMTFIFDTGASNVSISLTEAQFLFKQGLLTESDIIKTETYTIANGELIECTKIILKKISIDNIVLENIEANVVHELNAPLLLGMSAIQKLGSISIENDFLIINKSILSKKNEEEVKETINWINNVFEKNKDKWWGVYRIENIYSIKENYIMVISFRNFCSGDGTINAQVPLNNIKPIIFLQNNSNNNYELIFETLTGNEIVWYQNEDCGQINKRLSINLSSTIEKDNLKERIQNSFNKIISIYN